MYPDYVKLVDFLPSLPSFTTNFTAFSKRPKQASKVFQHLDYRPRRRGQRKDASEGVPAAIQGTRCSKKQKSLDGLLLSPPCPRETSLKKKCLPVYVSPETMSPAEDTYGEV